MKIELLNLLNEKDFVSGEYLAEKLGVSRTAIWKQIKSLEKLGYKIESLKNKGYRLMLRPDIPIAEEITPFINTKIIGQKVYYFDSITSTNTYAKNLVEENNISEGTVIVADIQTKGRGRKNRTWFSSKGGLWFSTVLYPRIPPESGMLVTMTSSISVAQAIKDMIGLKPVIKWPNDLLLNGKKVCGILTELNAELDQINYIIVGIGINVYNNLDEEINSLGTTLKDEFNKNISRVKLLRLILEYFDENYARLIYKDFEGIRNLWFSYANILGKKILVDNENKAFEGIVNDVDDSGCLIVKTESDVVRVVSGDIKYL
ncbi:MAG: biotin--[acetyl-CoA-carboxylase] ligase [Promethearchaeota archaeon]|jgi:BirA family biotin operon repressor/biotin-[acetyl-CoA-carboxylase] ligase